MKTDRISARDPWSFTCGVALRALPGESHGLGVAVLPSRGRTRALHSLPCSRVRALRAPESLQVGDLGMRSAPAEGSGERRGHGSAAPWQRTRAKEVAAENGWPRCPFCRRAPKKRTSPLRFPISRHPIRVV
jgi:hypothetical protein